MFEYVHYKKWNAAGRMRHVSPIDPEIDKRATLHILVKHRPADTPHRPYRLEILFPHLVTAKDRFELLCQFALLSIPDLPPRFSK